MKVTHYTAALAATCLSFSSAASIPRSFYSISKRGTDGLPDSALSTNCISVGFLPSDGSATSPRYTLAQIDSALGAKAATYGFYAQIKDSSFDGSQLTAVLDDVKASGAVFVASVMPSLPLSEVTSDIAQKVATVMKKFTDEGIEVWLRFGHEMNWYVTDGTYHGSASEFITAWKNIYAANCQGNDKVKCFWSPNRVGDVSTLAQWWPGKEYVDIVGIDCYPSSSEDTSDTSLFTKLYGDFYNTYSKANDLPFAIGETGAGDGQKENWLKQLVSADTHAKYPNYVSMSWFEYDKEADFRIVMADSSTLEQTKSILGGGSSSGSCSSANLGGGGGGNSTQIPTQPSATSVPVVSTKPTGTEMPTPSSQPQSGTGGLGAQCSASSPCQSSYECKNGQCGEKNCSWGCWGWDCSASSPCHSGLTCQGGYCK